jgi:chromosomal replication initiation ATPase DnaA
VAAAGEFEVSVYHLCARGNARQALLYDERDCARFLELLGEIGKLFGGLDHAAVAQRIRRTKSIYNPIAARRLITTMLNI